MIDKKNFLIVAINLNKKIYIIFIAYLGLKIIIHFVLKVKITLFLAKKIIVFK